MAYTVYMHISPNHKRYVGITRQSLIRRWNNGRGYKDNKYFHRAILKYGWENIKHEILFTNLTKEEAEQKEIEMIAKYKSNQKHFGYNIQNGGNCRGTVSEETKEKIRKANLGKKLSKEMNEKLQQGHREKCRIPVICIETNEIFDSAKSAGEKYKRHGTHITACCRGKYKTVNKLHFKYLKDFKGGENL